MDSIPSPETRTELFEGATEGPWEWTDEYPTIDDRETMSLTGNGGYGILSCDGMANSPQSIGIPANARLLSAAPRLLRERDTLLARLEGIEREVQHALRSMPCPADGGGWFYPQMSPDGDYLGEVPVHENDVIGQLVATLESIAAMTTGRPMAEGNGV